MAQRKSSRVNPEYKTKYRVVNWAEYDRALRNRGSLTVWFSPEAIAQWTPPKDGRRGRPPEYSDSAIATALTLRLIFHLPLRQTEGFVASLLTLWTWILGHQTTHAYVGAGRSWTCPNWRRCLAFRCI